VGPDSVPRRHDRGALSARLVLFAAVSAIVLALGSTAGAASADAGAPSNPPRSPSRNGPRNAIAVYPLALLSPGFALEYERFVAPPRVSFASGIGFIRGAARG